MIVYERFQLWRSDGKNSGVLGWWSLTVAPEGLIVLQVKFMIYSDTVNAGGGLRPENSVGGVIYPDPSFRPRARDIS